MFWIIFENIQAASTPTKYGTVTHKTTSWCPTLDGRCICTFSSQAYITKHGAMVNLTFNYAKARNGLATGLNTNVYKYPSQYKCVFQVAGFGTDLMYYAHTDTHDYRITSNLM